MELPEALKRKAKKHRVRENKKRYGTSISSRPEIASLRLEEGHWEGDTVVGKRAGKESVVFSLLEKKTETYLAFRIPGKTSEAVMNLMNTLHDEYGEHFSQVFKTITGHGYSVLEIVKAFETANGVSLPYQIDPRRDGDIAACYADTEKATRVLGWRAEHSLVDMCRDAWRWQQNYLRMQQS